MLALVLLSVLACVSAQDERIVGGRDVDIADFPWQGSLRHHNGGHICGCSLVGLRTVLTAAHCMGDNRFTLEFGMSVRNHGMVVQIESVLRHPLYMSPDFKGAHPNDIAIVTTVSPVIGKNIRRARIPQSDDHPTGAIWMTGWGRNSDGIKPMELQGVESTVFPFEKCSAWELWWDSINDDVHICVYDEVNRNTAFCAGDSGGPLSQNGKVYGVVSWTNGSCSGRRPSVYTRVSNYHDWICENAKDSTVLGC